MENAHARHPRTTVLAIACCLLHAGTAAAQSAAPGSLERVVVEGNKAAVSAWFRAESHRPRATT